MTTPPTTAMTSDVVAFGSSTVEARHAEAPKATKTNSPIALMKPHT